MLSWIELLSSVRLGDFGAPCVCLVDAIGWKPFWIIFWEIEKN